MKKYILPVVLIVASLIMIVVNIVMSEAFDKKFWFRNVSSILLILAMIFTLRSQKAKK